jgi:microcystin-dependent protein
MSRPTLADGEIWAASYANAAGYPILDGADEYGHGDRIPDEWLDPDPDYIKAQFYGWKNRIKITEVSGLTVSFTSAAVLLSNGNSVAINAGSITLPNNTSGRIFIDDTGAVVQGATFPQLCVPLAFFVTSGGAITTLSDLRYQAVEIVSPLSISATSIFSIGDIKESARSSPETGWLLCDGASYAVATYPLLHRAIGTTYNNPGDPLGTFRVPDCRQRSTIGAGTDGILTNRPLGTKVGSETHVLTVNEMPAHSHSASQSAHNHGLSDPGHTHAISDPGHTHAFAPVPHVHGVSDPGHQHLVASRDSTAEFGVGNVGAQPEFIAPWGFNQVGISHNVATSPQGTNIAIAAAAAAGFIGASGVGISVVGRGTGITIQNAAPAISVSNQGGNAGHNNMQPSIVLQKFIRAL